MENHGTTFAVILFAGFLLVCLVLILRMFFYLLQLGDERRQAIVGKACTFSFTGTVGSPARLSAFVLPKRHGAHPSPCHPHCRRRDLHHQSGLVQAETGGLSVQNKIRDLRKALGLSQEELAQRCKVSRQTINAIENNKYDPTLALAFHLAQVLETTVDALFQPVEP